MAVKEDTIKEADSTQTGQCSPALEETTEEISLDSDEIEESLADVSAPVIEEDTMGDKTEEVLIDDISPSMIDEEEILVNTEKVSSGTEDIPGTAEISVTDEGAAAAKEGSTTDEEIPAIEDDNSITDENILDSIDGIESTPIPDSSESKEEELLSKDNMANDELKDLDKEEDIFDSLDIKDDNSIDKKADDDDDDFKLGDNW